MGSARIAMMLAGASLLVGCNILIGLDAGKTSQGSSTSVSSSGGGGGGQPAAGTMVPLYAYPAHGNMWDQLVAAKAKHPTVEIVAIVNPDNGPGDALDPTYRTATKSLANGGVAMLGYVDTTDGMGGKKPSSQVKDEIDHYHSWYRSVHGIFFDGMSTHDGDQDYYASLTQYAKNNDGFTRTVGNPGTHTLESYVATVDTLIIDESTGLPSISSITTTWYTNHDPSHFGILAHSVPTLNSNSNFVSNARQVVRYVYITDGAPPHEWDSLPPYFDQLLDALE